MTGSIFDMSYRVVIQYLHLMVSLRPDEGAVDTRTKMSTE